jgi:CheY-like chemotaxis protein
MGNGENILVVDDDKNQRRIAAELLRKLCYSVNTVASGEEAVEYLRGSSADLLILDMIMSPGIDGLETYKRILKYKPNQKAIIASGYSETDRVRKAQEAGAANYISRLNLERLNQL